MEIFLIQARSTYMGPTWPSLFNAARFTLMSSVICTVAKFMTFSRRLYVRPRKWKPTFPPNFHFGGNNFRGGGGRTPLSAPARKIHLKISNFRNIRDYTKQITFRKRGDESSVSVDFNLHKCAISHRWIRYLKKKIQKIMIKRPLKLTFHLSIYPTPNNRNASSKM